MKRMEFGNLEIIWAANTTQVSKPGQCEDDVSISCLTDLMSISPM